MTHCDALQLATRLVLGYAGVLYAFCGMLVWGWERGMSSSNQPLPSFAIAALKELGAEADFSSRLFVWTPPAYGLFLFGRS